MNQRENKRFSATSGVTLKHIWEAVPDKIWNNLMQNNVYVKHITITFIYL